MSGPASTFRRVMALRASGKTQRCHALPHHGEYSVAEHSAQALTLLLVLYPGDPPAALIRAVLWHDAAERLIGDTPSPALRESPALGRAYFALERGILEAMGVPWADQLPLPHKAWLSAVDRIEFYLWTREQMRMGNQEVAHCAERVVNWFRENKTEVPHEAWEFMDMAVRSLEVPSGWLVPDTANGLMTMLGHRQEGCA